MTKKRRKQVDQQKTDTEPEPAGTIMVDQEVTACPKCGSTDRDGYHNVVKIPGPVAVMGVIYSRIELRRTRCRDCRQCRIDRYKIPMS